MVCMGFFVVVLKLTTVMAFCVNCVVYCSLHCCAIHNNLKYKLLKSQRKGAVLLKMLTIWLAFTGTLICFRFRLVYKQHVLINDLQFSITILFDRLRFCLSLISG